MWLFDIDLRVSLSRYVQPCPRLEDGLSLSMTTKHTFSILPTLAISLFFTLISFALIGNNSSMAASRIKPIATQWVTINYLTTDPVVGGFSDYQTRCGTILAKSWTDNRNILGPTGGFDGEGIDLLAIAKSVLPGSFGLVGVKTTLYYCTASFKVLK